MTIFNLNNSPTFSSIEPALQNFRVIPTALSNDEPIFAFGKNLRGIDNAGGTEILVGALFKPCLKVTGELFRLRSFRYQ
jgi:hypothetical protein